jgi:hypothetical protein
MQCNPPVFLMTLQGYNIMMAQTAQMDPMCISLDWKNNPYFILPNISILKSVLVRAYILFFSSPCITWIALHAPYSRGGHFPDDCSFPGTLLAAKANCRRAINVAARMHRCTVRLAMLWGVHPVHPKMPLSSQIIV